MNDRGSMVPFVAWLALSGCASSTFHSSSGNSTDAAQNGGSPSGAGGASQGTGTNSSSWPATADAGVGPRGGLPATGGVLAGGGMAAMGGRALGSGGATAGFGGTTAAGGATRFGGSISTGGRPAGMDAGVPYGGATGMSPDASVPCTVNIGPYSTVTLQNLPGDTAIMAVKGTILWGSSTPTQPNWQWTVKGPDGTSLKITYSPITDGTTAVIQYPTLAPGSYDISVSVTSSCKGHASSLSVKPQENSQAYFIRILPPPAASAGSGQTCDNALPRWCPSQDAVPYEDNRFMLQAGQPRQYDVLFVPGHEVSIDPVAARQSGQNAFPAVAVPSYIRVSPQRSTWSFDGASSSDQGLRAVLDPQLTYDVLVVPQVDTSTNVFPPFLLASKEALAFQPDDFQVAVGVTLRGTLRTASGPAALARILLYANASEPVTLPLPSMVGGADATGAYSLHASAGTLFSAVVIPPYGTSLPRVTIADCIDLQATASGVTLDNVDFTWNAISTTTLTLRALLSDKSTPAANVTVRLQSEEDALPDPGVLSVAGASAGSASGSVQQDGTTDASGSIVFANIPKIAYQLTLTPPSDLDGAAITSGRIDLTSAAASFTSSVNLGHKVTLSGSLLPAGAADGARLVATDTGTDVLVNIMSTPVDSKGSYQFLADPGRTYRFSVEPAAGKNLPTRIPLYGVTTTDQDTQLKDRTLPSGLKVSGIVRFSGKPVGGAIVQAYCEWFGIAGCVDPNYPKATLPPPLVEVATMPDGSYSFYLPDPSTGGGYALP